MEVQKQIAHERFQIWVSTEDKIVSCHWVEHFSYIEFREHKDFLTYMQSLAENSYRFQ